MRDIQLVLERWGVWSRERVEPSYSNIAAGFKGLFLEPSKRIACNDEDGLLIDSCVAKLKEFRPDEYELIKKYYINGISKRRIAKIERCDEKKVRIKIKMGEGFIDGCLSMLGFKE